MAAQLAALQGPRAGAKPVQPNLLDALADRLAAAERQTLRIDAATDQALNSLDRPGGARHLWDVEAAILELATFEQAVTPLGAMLQVVAAKSHLDTLAEAAIGTPEEEEAGRCRWAVTRSLLSLMNWIEATSGLQRSTFAFDSWMPAYIDTTAKLAAEEAAAAR